jgi:photosystem II stability/assembly factor-like uncharacterized protein
MRVRHVAPLLLFLLLTLPPSRAAAQWQKAPDFPNDFFNEVQFVDNSTGWVTRMSGTVSRTTDGGASWQSSALPGAGFSSNRDLCFLSRSLGFVSGEDGIWKTTDGGATWTAIGPSSGFTGGSTAMWFTDANTGVAGVGGCIDSTVTFFRTTNGGASWTSVQYTSSLDVAVGGMTFANGTFYACGGRGKLWRSSDGGASWTLSNTGSNGWQEDIISYGGDLLIASTTGSACGVASGGTVLRSTNGGATWTTTSFPSNLMWGVTRYSSTEGWAVGDGGLALKTTDGGSTWIEQSCGLPRAIRVDDVCFSDATHGWAVGDGLYRLADQTITVSPDTIDFGDVRVGTTSRDSSAIVRSFFTTTTSATLRLGGVDPGQFEIAGGTLSIPVGVCSSSPAPARFKPTSRGVKTALLEVTAGPNATRRYVVLKGRGIEPEISVMSTAALDTIVCGTSVDDSVLVRNVGTAPLVVTKVTHRDPAGGVLQAIAPLLPVGIPPGGQIWLHVRATATVPGPYESQLEIHSDDAIPGHSPTIVKMRYYRRSVVASLGVDTLTMPATAVGTRSTSCVEYRNNGDGMQWLDAVDPMSADTAIAAGALALPIALAPGASVRLCFDGTPADTGWFVRRFRVRGSPCGSDTLLTVRVYGTTPSLRSDTLFALAAITCETAARATATIANDGNDTLRLERPDVSGPDAAGATIVAPATWPLRIAPHATAEIVVDLEPLSAAEASASLTFVTNDQRAGRDRFTFRVTARRNSAVARPLERFIDLGSFCRSERRIVAVHVEGSGNAQSHVSGARVLEGIATIVQAPTGIALDPGARDSLVVLVAPDAAGAFRALVELRSEPCGRIDTVELAGTATDVILVGESSIDLGAIMRGRPATATLSVRNAGNAPATITASSLSGDPRVAITSPSLPVILAPGASVTLSLAIDTDSAGTIDESLRFVATADCADTLTVAVRATVAEPGGVSILLNTPSVGFGTLLRCEDSCSKIELEAVGVRPVTVTAARLEGGSGAITIGAIATPIEILPGARVELPVCYAPLRDGENETATLVLTTSDTASPELRVPLHGQSVAGLSSPSALAFGVVPKGESRQLTLTVTNPSVRDLTIVSSDVPAPFSVVTSLPLVVPAGRSADLVLSARDIDGYARISLVLRTSHPCGDSLSVILEALSDDRFTIGARVDTTTARWGERVLVPVAYDDETASRTTELELLVSAAPTLLDPATQTAAPGIIVERTAFDPTTGELRLRVRSADGKPLATTPALVTIAYDVLRGDRIETPIVPVITGVRPGITTMSRPGALLLADYCDAHARLLTTLGHIELSQNVPNPARTATMIEFETSFDGPVLLALYDARGIEVARIVDETMPAGRRRVAVAADALPAGVYWYRLTTGLQTRTRSMVVTP